MSSFTVTKFEGFFSTVYMVFKNMSTMTKGRLAMRKETLYLIFESNTIKAINELTRILYICKFGQKCKDSRNLPTFVQSIRHDPVQ